MVATSVRRMGATEWALLAGLSVLWGGSFFFAKLALRDLAPLTLVLARVGLAALALGLVLVALRQKVPTARLIWLAFAGMGLLNNLIPFSLIFWGQTTLTAGHAAILNATTPLFTVLVAHAATQDERLTPAKLVGVLLGFAGVTVLVGPGVLAVDRSVWAQIACLGAALSYACAGVFGRRFDSKLISALPAGIDPCGENGEFHSFVTGGPMLSRKIAVKTGKTVTRDGFAYMDFLPA